MFAYATKLHGVPGWKAFKWEGKDRGFNIVTGSVPIGTYTKGPRAGTPKWPSRGHATEAEVIITKAELDAEAAIYESKTGNCYNCSGSGQELAGWSKDTGARYRSCSTCKGEGKAI